MRGQDAVLRLRDGRETRLRRVREDDAPRLLALERAVLEAGVGMVRGPENLRNEAAMRHLLAPYAGASARPGVQFVAESGEQAAGSVRVRRMTSRRTRHVGRISLVVSPAWQGVGLGRALMERAIDWARHASMLDDGSRVTRLELESIGDNTRALRLYGSLGFETEGRRRACVRRDDGSFADGVPMALLLRDHRNV